MVRGSAGSIIIELDFDPRKVQTVRLSVPLLGIDQYMAKTAKFDRLPAGIYDATFTLYLGTGEQMVRAAKLRVKPDSSNIMHFHFSSLPQEVFIRPVDSHDRTIVAAEIKIETIHKNFMPVRDWRGLSCQLAPGQYMVKVVLPDLELKNFPIQVTANIREIKLPLDDPSKKRREPRVNLTVPVDYRTNEGFWISTESINLSSTGACLLRRRAKSAEGDIYVRLFVPLPSGPLECPARIRWMRDMAPEQMGVELFLTNAMRTSLSNWLASKP